MALFSTSLIIQEQVNLVLSEAIEVWGVTFASSCGSGSMVLSFPIFISIIVSSFASGGSFPCFLNTSCLLFNRSAHLGFWLNFLIPLVKLFFHSTGEDMSGCQATTCKRRLFTLFPQVSHIPGSQSFLWMLVLSTNLAYASLPWCLNKCLLKMYQVRSNKFGQWKI